MGGKPLSAGCKGHMFVVEKGGRKNSLEDPRAHGSGKLDVTCKMSVTLLSKEVTRGAHSLVVKALSSASS